MKKLMTLAMLFTLFITPSMISLNAQSNNLIDGDFADGVPDSWELYNISDTKVINNEKTRFYVGTSTNPIDNTDTSQISLNVDLPPGSYQLNVDSVVSSEIYSGDNDLRVFTGDSGGNFYSLSGDNAYEDTFLYIEVPEGEYLEYINIVFEGGIDPSTETYDYMDVTELELIRLSGIEYYDNVTLEGPIDTTIGSVDEPSQFTSSNLEDATIYFDNDYTGLIKVVDEGIPKDGWSYDFRSRDFRVINDSTGEYVNLYYDAYYDTVQGDIVAGGWENVNYPIKVHVYINDLTATDDIYDFPLEDYYMYQWTLTQDEATSGDLIPKDFGVEEYFTEKRLLAAHLHVIHGDDNVNVLLNGIPTELPITSPPIVFDTYSKTDDFFLLRDGSSNARFLYYYDSNNLTDLRAYNFDFDSGVSEITLRMYLPKDTGDIDSEFPGVSDDPTSPGGAADSIQSVLGSLGMDTVSGNIVFVVLTLLVVNIALIFLKIRGIALPIVNLALLGLLFYGGFVPFWVMMTITTVLVLMFIGMRGGMQRYE